MLCKQVRGFQVYDIVSAHVSSLIIVVLLFINIIIIMVPLSLSHFTKFAIFSNFELNQNYIS